MGKLLDYCMTGNWEETQRIALYKKLGNAVEGMNEKQIKKLIENANL